MEPKFSQDWDKMFNDLSNDSPFLKMAIEGFAGTGKTFLTANLAIGLWKKIGSKKPILIQDTEQAFRTLVDLFNKEGIPVKIINSRSLKDTTMCFKACQEGFADIFLIDSITHIWDQFKTDYLKAKSERMSKRQNRNITITKLSFPDWGYLKPKWKAEFSNKVVLGNHHIIFTGRAGYDYDHQEDDNGKMTELIKTGIKMKAETETAYEPDVLVLTETIQELLGKQKKVYRRATILKDRYRIIDGKSFTNASFKDFEPMIDKALDGTAKTRTIVTHPDDFSELDNQSSEWSRHKDIAIEEIKNIFKQMGFDRSTEGQAVIINLLETCFGPKGFAGLEAMKAKELKEKLQKFEHVKMNGCFIWKCVEEKKRNLNLNRCMK